MCAPLIEPSFTSFIPWSRQPNHIAKSQFFRKKIKLTVPICVHTSLFASTLPFLRPQLEFLEKLPIKHYPKWIYVS